MPRGRKPYKSNELKEKREYSTLPTAEEPARVAAPTAEEPARVAAPAVPDKKAQLASWMKVHDIPNGWRRELMVILKDVL